MVLSISQRRSSNPVRIPTLPIKMAFIQLFQKTPLFLAVRRNDPHAVKLLLSFNADPNVLVRELSLVALAAQKGYPEVIQLLLEAKANLALALHSPLIEVLKRGNRLVLAVLLEGRTDLLLRELQGHILIWHAVKEQSSLVPEIALATQEEIRRRPVVEGEVLPKFPPVGLSRKEEALLLQCLKLNQKLESMEPVKEAVERIKPIWQ
jgi:hypothetical protein